MKKNIVDCANMPGNSMWLLMANKTRKNLKKAAKATLVFLLFCMPVLSFSQLHQYLFNPTLAELGGGPALTERLTCGALPGGVSQQSEVRGGTCVNFNAWCYGEGGGFRYSNPGLITDSYTINMYCKFQGQGYLRILDFRGGTDDRGLYFYNGCLVYYNVNVIGPCPSLLFNTYYLLTVVRDGTTNTISVYINGVLFGTIGDAAGIIRPTTNTSPIDFFTDNNCESPYGCIRYASVTPNIATAGQIATLYASLPTLTGEVISPGPSVSVTPTIAALNCTTPNTTLTVNGTGTYVWSSGQTTATNLVNAANTYSVTLTDANGCTASASSIVTLDNTPPTAAISPSSGILNCSNLSVNLTATGGGTYNWGGGIITASRSVSSPATYTVTVTGANGCTATASSSITQNVTPPIATVTPTAGTITCSSPNILLTAGGGTNYNWGAGITTITNTVNSSGTYTVTVTAANGCTATASSVVSQNITPPIASVSSSNASLTCSQPTATLTASGGGTYNWGGGITTAANTVNAANTYTVTVTAVNGCTATASSVVSQNTTPPIASVSPSNASLTCSQPTATLTASGGGTYNWGGGITTAANAVNAANTYTVTVTGANGCTATANATVSQSTTIPVAAINPSSAVLTCTAPNVTLTASGGATYNWGGGITTASNTISTTGNYTVTVTGVNGCTATATVSVSQNNTPPTASINPASAVITCASPNITLTASGGGTYNWGGGITTPTNTVSGANTYTITVTSANGCSATASSIITQNTAPPALSITPSSAVLTCTTTSVTLTANGIGNYNWGGGITTATNLVSTANTYSVTLTDGNGCTASASSIVSSNITPPTASVSPSTITLTCTQPTAVLTASGGGTYDWGSGITTASNTVNTANTYSVTVTGTNGCTAIASSIVTQNTTLPATVINPSSAILTCTSPATTLIAGGGISYDWGGGITTASNFVSSPGNYTVTATGINGCTASASILVTQNNTPPAASITPANGIITCSAPNITLTASGGGTYDWGSGNTTANNIVSGANTYTVTVTGTNGCSATVSSVITQNITPPPLSISPSSTVLTCASPSVLLTANGVGTYNWGSGITTATNLVSTANTYSVTLTDINGCTASASSIVSSNTTPPIASVTPANSTITCVTLSVALTASGGATYDWGGAITTATNTVTSANTYTVTVTGSNGCTATASAVITQDITPPAAAVLPASGTLTCTTNSINLTAAGGNSYDWGAGITTANNTITQPNSYTVTVTGTNGCTATASSVITQDITPPVANITPANATLTCASPTAILTASGGISYNWGGGIITASNTVNTPNTYNVTVTAANGCTATTSAIITQSVTVPPAAVTPPNAAIDCNNATAILTASGGVSYNWGGGITGAANTVGNAGTYVVTVTDINGCTATASSTVSQDFTPPTASVTTTSPSLTCVTLTTTLTATGGATYDWGGAITTATNTVTSANTYTVTVTGSNGCTATASAVITQDITPPAGAVLPASGTLTCTTNSINLTASGGISYDWGAGITTANNTITQPNSYTVTVTGTNGCTATASSVITQDITPPVANITPANATLTCASPTAILTASGGTTYSWGGGIITATNTVTLPNTYSVTVTAANGCTASNAATISQNITTPNVSIAPAGVLTCTLLNTTLTASSSTPNATFNWGAGNTNTTNTVNSGGNYTVTATDPVNGCTATASMVVAQNITTPNISVSVSGILSCANTNVTITASSTTANATYNWGAGNTTINNIVSNPGNYSVTATDPANSCTALATQAVTQNITPPTLSIATPQELNCTNSSVTLSATSTVPGIAYNWGGGITTPSNTVSSPASYSVTATDPINGCTATASSTVNQNITIPSAAIAPPNVITCHSPSVTLLSSTNAVNPAYNWGGNNTASGYAVSTTGTYAVTITDLANGCSASASAIVTNVPLMNLAQSHTNVSCFGFTDGAIDLIVTGGQAPFAYTWSNNTITEDLTAIPAAVYSVVVTDGINCTANLSIQITEPASMLVTESHTNVTCNGANNGAINLNTSAGTPVYTYRWNDNNVNEDRANLAPGNYSVTVTDNNGCSVSATSSITEPPAIDIQPTITQPTCASNGNDGTISVIANGGTAPFSFSWSNGISTTINPGLGEGNYTITVTDANACAFSATYQLSYIYNFAVDASAFSTIKLGQSANINYTLTGNTGNYTASWSPALTLSCSNCTAPVATPVYSTLYNITITNNVGCYASDTVGVQVLPLYETFVPNVFTPNGDGVNDVFEMFGNLNGIEYIEMQIFDRKGEKVFESNDHHFIWDGTFKGVALEPQVLVWKMKLTWLNEHKEELRKGTLTLVK